MTPIDFINRLTQQKEREAVFGEAAIRLLYGQGWLATLIGRPLRCLASKYSLFSRMVGWWQQRSWTKAQIKPFIETYQIDVAEFLDPVEGFSCFNDFFIRKLKPTVRPIADGGDDRIAVIPADGRYLLYPQLATTQLVDVKGRRLNLTELLGDQALGRRYEQGSLVMARLCPTDYHRFHFPITCVPTSSRLINGALYSVNPIAIKQNIRIFSENKRMITKLYSPLFGDVLCIEVGATTVGSIHQTYAPDCRQEKGAEKGFFSFGGSSMLLLFLPGSIAFDEDLLQAMDHGLEIRCLMGQRLGTCS